jgi:transposase
MSLSKIFHTLFATKDATLENIEHLDNAIIFHARVHNSQKKCSCCGSQNVHIKESKERSFRGCNLGNKKTFLKLIVHKFLCLDCKKRRWMKLPFTWGKFPLTKSFINYIIALNAISTLFHVAQFLGLEWKTVKNIDKAHLKKRPKQFAFKKLRYISIDEIAIRKGHKYMTIFTDIATGQIIYAVRGRKEEIIAPFLKQLAKRAKRLKGIAMDMSAGYSAAVSKYLPHVAIVFDRFHVTKVLNGALDEVRKEE